MLGEDFFSVTRCPEYFQRVQAGSVVDHRVGGDARQNLLGLSNGVSSTLKPDNER
jgi:hypothetical protein